MIINVTKQVPVYDIVRYRAIKIPCSCVTLEDFYEGFFMKMENGSPLERDAYSMPKNLQQGYDQWKIDNKPRLEQLLFDRGL